jgi:hypothetical protein
MAVELVWDFSKCTYRWAVRPTAPGLSPGNEIALRGSISLLKAPSQVPFLSSRVSALLSKLTF